MLRQLLDPQLKPLLAWDLNKDYTQASLAQLREHIDAQRLPG